MPIAAGQPILASDVLALIGDTGEISLSLGANWTAYYRAYGKVVEFYATYAASVAGGATVTASTGIPAGYLPVVDTPLAAFGIAFTSIAARITAAGSVSIFNTSGSAKNPVTCQGHWMRP